MVFYRKYRPQTLDELIGQEHIVSALSSAFSTNKLSSAYLFCGPKGTGKTSTARILAKMVNCQSVIVDRISDSKNDKLLPITDIPCNKCVSCISITEGANLDVIEIDAASNRGIDDIRDLREKIKLSPTSLRKKVYIIDEVHMLSTEAFNALLKTLEEPPSHVLFILATTEAHKIPETILSRVQKMDFKQASFKDLSYALEVISKEEKIEVEDGVLEILAKKSSGSFRDGVKLLDQMSSNQPVTKAKAEEFLLSSDFDTLSKILEFLIKKDSQNALKIFLSQVELGINIKEFSLSLIDLLRSVLFIKYELTDIVKEEVGSDKFKAISNLSKLATKEDLLKIIENFEKGFEKLKTTSIPSFPIEVAIIESGLNTKPNSEEKQVIEQIVHKTVVIEPVVEQVLDSAPDSGELSMIKDKWNYILETIRSDNFSLEAMLKQVKILSCDGGKLTLEVPYSFHQRIIEAPKSRDLLESVVAEVLGKNIKVATVLGKREVKSEDLANIELAADDEIIRVAAEIFNSESIN